MKPTVIPFTTEADWLRERAQDVTSTESAALFEASPYATAFELYHRKREGYVVARDRSNARMRWGRRLQEPIAYGVAEDQGLDVVPMREYLREPAERIGSSFDYRVVGARGRGDKTDIAQRLLTEGEGIMEIKTVDPMAFREAWSIVDGEVLEAPPHIELQVQHQLLVSGLQWALIVALIGGNRVSMIERSYDPEIGAAILRKVREFWQLVDQGTPPAPDYTRDAATIAHLYVESTAGKVLDCREDAHLAAWVTRHQSLGEQVRQYTKERDELKARILERVGDASRILLPDYATLACGTVRESIVPEHVRGAYRNLRFYQRKDKQS